jgi:hypothetical protein
VAEDRGRDWTVRALRVASQVAKTLWLWRLHHWQDPALPAPVLSSPESSDPCWSLAALHPRSWSAD